MEKWLLQGILRTTGHTGWEPRAILKWKVWSHSLQFGLPWQNEHVTEGSGKSIALDMRIRGGNERRGETQCDHIKNKRKWHLRSSAVACSGWCGQTRVVHHFPPFWKLWILRQRLQKGWCLLKPGPARWFTDSPCVEELHQLRLLSLGHSSCSGDCVLRPSPPKLLLCGLRL